MFVVLFSKQIALPRSKQHPQLRHNTLHNLSRDQVGQKTLTDILVILTSFWLYVLAISVTGLLHTKLTTALPFCHKLRKSFLIKLSFFPVHPPMQGLSSSLTLTVLAGVMLKGMRGRRRYSTALLLFVLPTQS